MQLAVTIALTFLHVGLSLRLGLRSSGRRLC
jgi:hypothetical protein